MYDFGKSIIHEQSTSQIMRVLISYISIAYDKLKDFLMSNNFLEPNIGIIFYVQLSEEGSYFGRISPRPTLSPFTSRPLAVGYN